ncbi:MAG: amidohydrolase [Lachnospiraceae bacterium]|nr:amidohydrolase [Lachnospiraceae bacterium]
MITVQEVKNIIEEVFPQVVEFRRDLHMHPELSGEEERTSMRIKEEMDKLGIPWGTNWQRAVFGTLAGGLGESAGKYKGVAIRADFDALPILEETGLPYASQNPGVMHACGHDVHTAVLLGSAMVLNRLAGRFGGNVKFFFQPSEEKDGGADNMIKAGCMTDPPVDAVFGLHINPTLPTGHLQFCPGPMNAATCTIYIDVEGIGCHGAHPDTGVDTILVASHIVTALQAITARNLPPTTPGIVTIGSFHSGTKSNIIPPTARLEGTLRAMTMDVMDILKQNLVRTVENVAAAFGAKATVTLQDGCPCLENDPAMTELLMGIGAELFGEDHIRVMPAPSLGGDDFAFFSNYCDGCYFNLGTSTGNEEHPQFLHNEFLCPDEESMKAGILMEVITALKLLGAA